MGETSGPAAILVERKGKDIWVTVSGFDETVNVEAATIALSRRTALGHAWQVLRAVFMR